VKEEIAFRCPLRGGLHARPASQLVEVAGHFSSAIELANERTGERGNAKSVVAVIALDVRGGDPCRLHLDGSDAAAARMALHEFVTRALPAADDVPPSRAAERGDRPLPRVLREAGVRPVRGAPACPGIGRGRLVVAAALALPGEALAEEGGRRAEGRAEEQARVTAALGGLRAALESRLAAAQAPTEAGILRAHLAMARDVSIEAEIAKLVTAGLSAGRAVAETGRRLTALLARSASAIVRERAADVEDLCRELLERLGEAAHRPAIELDGPSVLLAGSLSPRELLGLDRRHLRALLLDRAGPTSHVVILARSFGIPTLLDAGGARTELPSGSAVVVDADLGFAILDEDPRVRRHYDRELAKREKRRERLARHVAPPAVTRDGRHLEVAANVATVEEVELAFECGAESIGLFRTEMLYLGRAEAPSEEEQLAVLAGAVRVARGRPVIVRALDAGGDKPLAYLEQPPEANPSLGRRGVRVYPAREDVFEAQLRAVLRAAALGPLRLMLPMVATPAEVRWVRERIAAAGEDLRREGSAFGAGLELGIMLEVPAAAFVLEELCREVDFVSLGTNDLAQYFFAADRENPHVASLADPRHPAFLRFLTRIVEEVRGHGRWIGMCGEMAGDPRCLPLLVGLGLDEISLAAPGIPAAKAAIARLDGPACRELLAAACACASVAEVEAKVAEFQRKSAAGSLTARDLVSIDFEGTSKAEVVQELVDLLHEGLRTEDPLAVEQAIWSREDTYSTGVGHGFAVPHCKTDAISATSLAVVRLARPVDWDAIDGSPVSCAILLAVRPSDDEREHMRYFSALARRLVHEDFRQAILGAGDAAAILACLEREVGTQSPVAGGRQDGTMR
jgi:fructose-specific PTS system IIA-like component